MLDSSSICTVYEDHPNESWREPMGAITRNRKLLDWVDDWSAILQPARVHWCDGSEAENDELVRILLEAGTFTSLNADLRPNSFLALSDPSDVARVEDRTFICTE